jgi:predicted nucleotidyltransferase
MNKEEVMKILKENSVAGCEVDLNTPEALHKAMKGQIMAEAVRAA